jgi:hypothetical protein
MKLYSSLLGMIFLTMSSFALAQDYSHEKQEYLKVHSLQSDKRLSGADTAAALTNDYANKATDCGGSSTPAFLCSGVLLRGTDVFSTSYHAWDPSPSSVTSGGVSFSYLRGDSVFINLAYNYNNGFIFFPYFKAPEGTGINTDIDIMCSFPIDAATANRSDKGCGASSSYPTQSGPCQDQGITTADQWYSHYLQGGRSHTYQCGFTTSDTSSYDTADGFYQTLLSMAKISSESFNMQNELRLATWPQGMQNSLPIEAFFYFRGSSTGLDSAKKNQQDFYNSTTNNIWVPVIEITLPSTPTAATTFFFNTEDQLIPEPGATIADILNEQYNNAVPDCGSESAPAFLCSGVTVRAVDPSNSTPWVASQEEGDAQSFSFLRTDSKFSKLAYGRETGLIFYPDFSTPDPLVHLNVYCSFPIDGSTLNRTDHGCGASSTYPNDSGPCQEQGITTAADWYNHYKSVSGEEQRHEHQCGFDVSDDGSYQNTADSFVQSLLSMQLLGSESFAEQNELRIESWSSSPVNDIPIQAFFYLGSADSLATVQDTQSNYYKQSGNAIPIVKMTLPQVVSDNVRFTYSASDQVVPLNRIVGK